MNRHIDHMRMVEAMLFAAGEPLAEDDIAARLPEGVALAEVLEALREDYEKRGVNLARVGGKWMFRTADDLAFLLRTDLEQPRKLSRAAVETLAIIAYHQPVTRAEIEEVRGVAVSKGTLDVLLESEWVRPKGRRRSPGRPVTYGTTEAFLVHFGLESLDELPGVEELKAAGLLDAEPPDGLLRLVAGDDEESEPGPEPENGPPVGNFIWEELLTSDPVKAAGFYGEVFGWATEEMDMGENGIYRVQKRGDVPEAGIMQKPPDAPGPSHWLSYVRVDDVDAAAARAVELGGRTFVEPMDVPSIGRMSVHADSVGGMFAVYKPAAHE